MIRRKYGNKKTEHNGIQYDSKKEATYASKLELLKNAADPKERVVNIERQVKYELIPKQVDPITGKCLERACNYLMDFVIHYANGRIEHVDVKGYATPEYKIKRKLLLHVYGIRIIEI